MKYVDEYRDKDLAFTLSAKIHQSVHNHANIMEICGGQTHTILKYNLEEFLPSEINLIHGPGCPVCVTPVSLIDAAISLAENQNNIIATYGDMLRVPGSETDLLSIKADGGEVRMIYSPLEAVKLAINNPDKNVIFFAVGFETTSPANAVAILEAHRRKLTNYFVLCSQMLVPPALEAILSSEFVKIDGILAAGHVCTVMGLSEYNFLSTKYSIPIVATGFEPSDLLSGILMIINQLNSKTHLVENQYSRAIGINGNQKAIDTINNVFEIEDREWRGIGIIPKSGLKLRNKFDNFDALKIFNLNLPSISVDNKCIAGQVLQGIKKPDQCESFGNVCNPMHPLGAPMVSSEGACAAYFKYKK